MVCTPICVYETVIMIGDIITKIWNSPLKDVFEDLLKKPKVFQYVIKNEIYIMCCSLFLCQNTRKQ